MRRFFLVTTYLFLFISFFSCSTLQQSPKYQLEDGFYHSSFLSKSGDRVYIENHPDTIKAFAATKTKGGLEINKTEPIRTFTKIKTDIKPNNYTFYKPSLDIDLITIPVKYRPVAQEFPRQLTSSVSGALYSGLRHDIFKIHYNESPLGYEERDINHFGISIGLFAGLGTTDMNPWVTQYAIDSEYSGLVFSKGGAVIAGFNNFSAGLALGFDDLLDKNNKVWIYEDKLWLGLVFGINLN